MTEYKKVITNIGEQIISRKGLNNEELKISYIAIGDANGSIYEPNKNQTELVNQLDLLPITEYIDDAPQHRFIADIPQDIDYYTIREIGLIDNEGNLIEIAQIEMPTKYNDESLLQELQIGMLLEITQSDNIVIVVDGTTITKIKNAVTELQNRDYLTWEDFTENNWSYNEDTTLYEYEVKNLKAVAGVYRLRNGIKDKLTNIDISVNTITEKITIISLVAFTGSALGSEKVNILPIDDENSEITLTDDEIDRLTVDDWEDI